MGKFDLDSRLRPLCACLSGAMALGVCAASAVAAEISTSALTFALARVQAGAASQVLGSVVTNCNDTPDPDPFLGVSLRYLVTHAYPGETIDVSNCSSITLLGGILTPPFAPLTISGNGLSTIYASDTEPAFGSQSNLTLANLTISGGVAVAVQGGVKKGGSIVAAYDVTLQNSTVSGGYAGGDSPKGGCIYAAGNVVLQHSTVSNCRANDYSFGAGGGISANTVTCTDSAIHHNIAYNGSGINASAISLLRCTIDHNSDGSGGAISGAQVTITSSTLSKNTKGIIVHGGEHAMIVDSNISGNNYGIFTDGGEATIVRSTIFGNERGIAAFGGYATIFNSTISGNTEDGIALTSASVALTASTVAMNLYGVACFPFGYISSQSSIIALNGLYDLKFNFYGGNCTPMTGADNLVITTDLGPAPGVITVTADPQLLPLGDYGGPTQTHALAATSPAIDKGSNTALLTTDQRGAGFARAFPAGKPDIGAYEFRGDGIFFNGFE